MNADIRFVPLAANPYAGELSPSRFRATASRALSALKHELAMLGAVNVVVEAGYKLGQLRYDGWPRAECKPSHPGVVLSFTATRQITGQVSFPAGKYTSMHDNLYAIAKTLEALRMVNRYGVARGDEQYKGWTQIGASHTGSGPMDMATARDLVYRLSNTSPNGTALHVAAKEALLKSHPDHGGTGNELAAAKEAWRILKEAGEI